jgi:hypothetical protein
MHIFPMDRHNCLCYGRKNHYILSALPQMSLQKIFNGDGHLDMLAIVDNNKIAWYENNGLQTFTEHFIVSNANNIRASFFPKISITTEKMDFMAAISHIDNKIVWYRNDGTGSFTEVIVTDNDDISGNYGDIFVKDMDSDGTKM